MKPTHDDYFISPIIERLRAEDSNIALSHVHELATNYMAEVDLRPVYPTSVAIDNLSVFSEELSREPSSTRDLLDMLGTYGSPATVAQTGGRYFGFVNGGILPAAMASKWLTDVWDQNAALYVMSPIASKLESVAEQWLKSLLNLPDETVASFVTGSSTATLCGLITGRNHLLDKLGYDVASRGLFGAPELKVIVGEGAHSTIYKALSMSGLGNERVIKVPCDDQGRIRVDLVPELDDHTLLILQAGHVTSGAFDPFESLCEKANAAGAWVHVDGAFGLWAAANPKMAHLTRGLDCADSWSADAHKTLNAPYDNGILLCRHKASLIKAMQMTGSYIILNDNRDGMLYTPEMSRRARAIDLWVTLKCLGSTGVAELVEELHAKALYFAESLKAVDQRLEILNNVVFNQVIVRFQDDAKTEQLMRDVQNGGVCWFGGAKWQGQSVIRISVCSYKTTYDDIDLCVAHIKALIT
jgi:glutamate/tyrosine decarboxylase-like PLP-dependent enzyme